MKKEDEAETYQRNIRERIRALRSSSPKEFLRLISAETNSLSHYGLLPSDKVILLHTETTDGRICAEEAGLLIEEAFQVTTRLIEVVGLQVKQAVDFRRIGIHNLISRMDRMRGENPDDEWVLNVTGGFKSVVPYMTLYGLIYRMDVIYLHETAGELIHLPPIPITFDFEHIGGFRDAIRALRREGVMSRAAFDVLIPKDLRANREWLRSLIEEEDGMVAPSGLAGLFFKETDEHTVQVLLSPEAQNELNGSSGFVRKQYLAMLARVSDPLWRDSKHHAVHGTDLTVWKPGRVSERVLGFVKGNRVFVCELAQHERYEELLQTRKVADYPESTFSTYIPPADAANLPESEDAELRELTDALAEKHREMDALYTELQANEAKLSTESEDLQNERAERERVTAHACALEAQLQEAKAYLALPIWKRLFRKPPKSMISTNQPG